MKREEWTLLGSVSLYLSIYLSKGSENQMKEGKKESYIAYNVEEKKLPLVNDSLLLLYINIISYNLASYPSTHTQV